MINLHSTPLETTIQNRVTEHVFNRFNIKANNSRKILDNTVLTEINPEFLVDILNIFCEYQEQESQTFNKYPVPVIIDYLSRCHTYYLEKIIPEIGQSITTLIKNYENGHPLLEILYKFYFKYKVDLQEHFKEEEDNIFLYAKKLYQAVYFKKDLSFFKKFLQQNSIHDFIENHSDTLKDLEEVTSILLKYNPPSTNISSYRILLDQLKNFHKDLKIHAFIEDDILIKKLDKLELRIRTEMNN